MNKQRTQKQLEKDMAEWNQRHPIGTPVTRYRLINPLREPEDTITRSEAWIMGGHSVVVKVDGMAGGVLIESLRLREAAKPVDEVLADLPKFELHRYNSRRKARGVEAALVRVTWPDGEDDVIWMSERDIRRNIKQFGESKGLQDALEAYKKNA